MFFNNKFTKAQQLFEQLCTERDNYISTFGENGDKAYMRNFQDFLKKITSTYQEFKSIVWDMNNKTIKLHYKNNNYTIEAALSELWRFVSMLLQHSEKQY